jgi:hypothetical protein
VDVTEICGLRFLNTFINIQIPYKQWISDQLSNYQFFTKTPAPWN